eukprot:TRINITY_DN1432_c0_g1_i3.p1 TRINITY_DN1432_c0_g1~~TRINITY_DN1432_c0_g1_i3.p1  ORF type:complete len:186 (+),score=5.85 TRINITY_DN1432_c0_g1_i3:686-1243(+)
MTEGPRHTKEQTWMLKVYIHCEGCERDVKKLLRKLPGVYSVSIDAARHKVTVTGNIESPDILLKTLIKAGKPAELWKETEIERKDGSKELMKDKEEPICNAGDSDRVKKEADDDRVGVGDGLGRVGAVRRKVMVWQYHLRHTTVSRVCEVPRIFRIECPETDFRRVVTILVIVFAVFASIAVSRW